MTPKIRLAGAFLSGALLAAALTSVVLLRWHRQQSQILWTTALNQHLRMTSEVHKGDLRSVQDDLDRRLPGLIRSVSSFGRNEQTLPVLRASRKLLLNHGGEIPADLQTVLQGL